MNFLTFRLAATLILLGSGLAHASLTVSERFHLDQFGYRPEATKVAVLSDPQAGYNSAESYTPGPEIEVRRVSDDAVAQTVVPQAWKGGQTHSQSGDKVWWVDFSSVTTEGEYYLADPTNGLRSYPFEISEQVYGAVLREATRVFYYQRSGFPKEAAYAGSDYVDAASFPQDEFARLVLQPGNPSTARDVQGGWYDAGDFNMYTRWTCDAITSLLYAFEDNPGVWPDDFNIPESGNGVPDLLDEIKWALDWVLKMQRSDGAVFSKVAVTSFQSSAPPSTVSSPRYYGEVSTSATRGAIVAFYHAARVFEKAGLFDDAATYLAAANAAWDWASANPSVIYSNSGFASANPELGSTYSRNMLRLRAAIHRFLTTGDPAARNTAEFDIGFGTPQPLAWNYWYAFEGYLQDDLLRYALHPDASTFSRDTVLNSYRSSLGGTEFLSAWNNQTDAYRAFIKDGDYTWGSNANKSRVGVLLRDAAEFGVRPADVGKLADAGKGFLHYLHGVNPTGWLYLTNMGLVGGDRSVTTMYHNWFRDGSVWDEIGVSLSGPAPGYLVGGPNESFNPDPAYSGPALIPPLNQPVQKAYRNWNGDWPENSWEITEPSIGYQVAYIRLLASATAPYDAYAVFRDSHDWGAIPAADRAANADANRNGMVNKLELALGGPVDQPAQAPLFEIVSTSEGPVARFFRASDDFTYSVRVSASLAGESWSTVAVNPGEVGQMVEVPLTAENERLFAVLSVE